MATHSIAKSKTSGKLICGIGINDADYVIRPRKTDSRICPFYALWSSVLTRVYCPKSRDKYPWYEGCKVAEEWHLFSNFRKWMEKQNWKGRQLDKDFLSDDKLYSPNTCIFMPGWLNSLFLTQSKHTDRLIGVHKDKRGNGYTSCIQMYNKKHHIGVFCTPEEACAAYLTAKRKYVESRYPEIAEIDTRLIAACERKLRQLEEKYG